VSDPDISERDRLAIEGEAARFLRDFERRSKRGMRLGCTWLLFVVICMFLVPRHNGVALWAFLTIGSFFALGSYLNGEKRRQREGFQRLFGSKSAASPRREIALGYLHDLARSRGRFADSSARKMLEELGLLDRARLAGHASAAHSARPPIAAASPPSAPPVARARPAVPAMPPTPALSARAVAPRAPAPAPSAASAADAKVMITADPIGRPLVEPTSSGVPRVLEPVSAPERSIEPSLSARPSLPFATEVKAAAPSSDREGDLVDWSCPSCGTRARLPRGAVHQLCPTCFPQIRLDV
jgi:hypothetical protein